MKRKWRIFLFGAAILIVVLCLDWLLAPRTPKATSLSDSDLRYVRPEIPAESNAFFTLVKAANAFRWPDASTHRLSDLASDRYWDDALVDEVLETNRTSLEFLDESWQKSLLVPEPMASDPEEDPYFITWKNIWRLDPFAQGDC